MIDYAGEERLSVGLKHTVKGYLSYAGETILSRALPEIDGLKPSQRRILHTIKGQKLTRRTKSANAVGATMKLHPHGDNAIYATMTRMTQVANYLNVPLIDGKGALGKVYTTDKPAASRYTECMLTQIANEEYFGEMNGVDMIASYDDTAIEPRVLPVSFPSILCNSVRGISVGMSSDIPSFNFHEVNNATIELIRTGEIKKPLVPDFPTGAEVVVDDYNLMRIHREGKGKIKMRGKWYIEGKGSMIVIHEIPYYATVEDIVKSAKLIEGVTSARDETDLNGMKIAIDVRSRGMVDKVIADLLRDTNLQMTVSANIRVIVEGIPQTLGVEELLFKWVEFRCKVLRTHYTVQLESVVEALDKHAQLLLLMENKDYVDEFVELCKTNELKAARFLRDVVGMTNETSINNALDMKVRQLSKAKERRATLQRLENEKALIEGYIAEPEMLIISQLQELNRKYNFSRKTAETDIDYEFEADDQKEKIIAPTKVAVTVTDGFIKKDKLWNANGEPPEGAFACMSNDVIAMIDNYGRILRVDLESVELSMTGRGTYIPSLVGLEADDNFAVMAYKVIEPVTQGYMYSDGCASVVDYSEWVDVKRHTRRTDNGVSPMANLIMAEIDLSKPYMLLLTNKKRFGIFRTNFKQKARTARTRITPVKDGEYIAMCVGLGVGDLPNVVSNLNNYIDKLGVLKAGDVFDMDYVLSLEGAE